MYGDRFENAIGAALTMTNTKSDFLSVIYDYVMTGCIKKKWKKSKMPDFEKVPCVFLIYR